jgi:hypothetical protein
MALASADVNEHHLWQVLTGLPSDIEPGETPAQVGAKLSSLAGRLCRAA